VQAFLDRPTPYFNPGFSVIYQSRCRLTALYTTCLPHFHWNTLYNARSTYPPLLQISYHELCPTTPIFPYFFFKYFASGFSSSNFMRAKTSTASPSSVSCLCWYFARYHCQPGGVSLEPGAGTQTRRYNARYIAGSKVLGAPRAVPKHETALG
jgi:hypothetical protein